jgi:hypothetical protein
MRPALSAEPHSEKIAVGALQLTPHNPAINVPARFGTQSKTKVPGSNGALRKSKPVEVLRRRVIVLRQG